MKVPFERDKYLRILRSQGVNEALTVLHRDIERWEFDTFETPEGYQPEMFTDLIEVRQFSRELWRIALEEGIHSPSMGATGTPSS
jgi:hypothetical protein